MEWNEIVANKDSMIRPLYNKEWLLSELKKIMVSSGDYDPLEADIVISEYDGDLVISSPVHGSDDNDIMMFGLLSSDEYLDDLGLLDYLLFYQFEPLVDYGAFSPGDMESVAGLYFDDVSKKELYSVLSYVIGESLSDPSVEQVQKIETKDCKKHIEDKFNFKNMKRTKKTKFGLIDVRVFENDDSEVCTILTYNGRIICSCPAAASDYE